MSNKRYLFNDQRELVFVKTKKSGKHWILKCDYQSMSLEINMNVAEIMQQHQIKKENISFLKQGKHGLF